MIFIKLTYWHSFGLNLIKRIEQILRSLANISTMKTTVKIKVYLFFLLGLLCLILMSKTGMAQNGYDSKDNYVGLWNDKGTWMKSIGWMGDQPGTNVGGATDYIHLYGYVTTSGNIAIAGSSELILLDTLWVNGNLIVSGGGSLVIGDNAVLVILGDFLVAGGTVTTSSGRVVVMGNVNATGGATVTNTPASGNAFYVYGNASQSGGATYNGSKEPASGNFQTQNSLYSNDPLLAGFVGSVLPITMLWVKATPNKKEVLIEWATASEINNEVFLVERSLDGIFYEVIGEVAGAGNSNVELAYTFYDKEPAARTAYYRIKQVDFDGKSSLSDVFAVAGLPEKTQVNVYPNPASERIFIHINQEAFFISLVDVNGNEVLNRNYDAGDQASRELDIASLKSGMYFLKIGDGRSVEVVPIIRQ